MSGKRSENRSPLEAHSPVSQQTSRYVANTDAESDPLISPTYVRMLGAIFDYKDLAAQSWQVRVGRRSRP